MKLAQKKVLNEKPEEKPVQKRKGAEKVKSKQSGNSRNPQKAKKYE